MLHREILSPEEVLERMPNLSEGLFAIRCKLTNKTYQIILYKYQEDYFLIENPALISVLLKKDQFPVVAATQKSLADNCPAGLRNFQSHLLSLLFPAGNDHQKTVPVKKA